MHQRRQQQSAEEKVEAERAPDAEFLHQQPGPARVHEIGLIPALEPARALRQPLAETDWRFLPRRRGQHLGRQAEPCECRRTPGSP